jgi:3-keto-5-aminohexanoate cleavage enzyme
MIKTDKLIICVAVCGSVQTKEQNPNFPIQPDEIAEEVYRSWNAGASIVHIHARDKNGKATTDPDVFREIKRLIRSKGCDIIVEFSTSPGREPDARVEDGFGVVEAGPEMATVDIGVAIFMRDGKEKIIGYTRAFDETLTKSLLEKNIKPEFEIYGMGGIVELEMLIGKMPIAKPYWVEFPLDLQRTSQNVTPYSPKNLLYLVEQLPPDCMFMSMGVGNTETPACVQSILLGGHARVGFEDNIYLKRGVLAKSNAELVEKIARIGLDLGRTVATPKETRSLLGLPEFNLSTKK